MQRFCDSLNRLPRFEVRLGRLARRGPDKHNQYHFEQKMVDVLLSIDLVALSTKGRITDVILVAGDSDFVPAIEVAKRKASASGYCMVHSHTMNYGTWSMNELGLRKFF